ncbi:MAG: Flp pilus assembly protein CpaB [Bdellovibrionales bacterium RIFOXYD12_FULL_39_22]|nr:MAG: Flp pilus assembly protein CpaB [Bdellovibrionales bacterium RIFOXYB1_FULL_39_21]OFZ40413.1 MAG: Flp pilus assembly protein CpaB [Bdellovibrionales bacterium RIFOXYC12_FULL_39_17]OFZ49662.1 MAG: Flp pilus assembly protein CpaB [Bdellovibrionales bacterium RIFOXYC1_FULL_39_130]OFZ73176.1 MAG: Flp pilus assembly protein CpaB [Bdellovibrionales bacterium RIFOXYC2_FULL_39_8]OFZ77332.1 MAG: Flp pilus assembly protein CpaB [Bdellovibrionales bacterium RIFOXYD1_FULL_39_84]OFZ95987.1 MAG: Flp 
MNTRAFTFALVISVVAMFMVITYISDKEDAMKRKYGDMKTVVVAKQDIQELEMIDDTKLQSIQMPSNYVSEHAFTGFEELKNVVAAVPILKGEIITKPRVTYPDAKTGLARQVTAGKRAIAISIGDDQAVGKLIKPGDRVDVIAPVAFDTRNDQKKIKTIIQDVLVLSTGKSITNSIPLIGVETTRAIKEMKLNVYTEYNNITLELSPYDVQKLIYIQTYSSGGRIYLSLRNNVDKEQQRINSTSIFDLLGDEEKLDAKKFFMEKYKQE